MEGIAVGPFNVCIRVEVHAGWLAKIRGERSTFAAIEREIASLNERGYRVVVVYPDAWGWLRKLAGFLVWFFTLGFVGRQPGVLIVGERVDV